MFSLHPDLKVVDELVTDLHITREGINVPEILPCHVNQVKYSLIDALSGGIRDWFDPTCITMFDS